MKQLEECVLTGEDVYHSKGIAVALGSAQCQGWISNGRKITLEMAEAGEKESIITNFVAPIEKITGVYPVKNRRMLLKKEESITDFEMGRYLKQNTKKNIIVPMNGEQIRYQLKCGSVYWKDNQGKIVVFITD